MKLVNKTMPNMGRYKSSISAGQEHEKEYAMYRRDLSCSSEGAVLKAHGDEGKGQLNRVEHVEPLVEDVELRALAVPVGQRDYQRRQDGYEPGDRNAEPQREPDVQEAVHHKLAGVGTSHGAALACVNNSLSLHLTNWPV